MKKYVLKLFVVLLIITSCKDVYSQIVFNGDTYTLNALGLNVTNIRDLNTNFYARSVPLAAGRSIIRKNGYWYLVYQASSSNGGGSYIEMRTLNTHFTVDPPCQALWYNNNTAFWNLALEPPAIPSSATFSNFAISGNTCSTPSQGSSYTNIEPTFIQLPRLTSTPSTTLSSDEGKMIFDKSLLELKYNNGISWSSIWPKISGDYDLSNSQKINFSTAASIYGDLYGLTADALNLNLRTSQLNILTSDGSSNLLSLATGNSTYSRIRFNSSIATKMRTEASSTTITNIDHIVVYGGNSSTQTFTLPSVGSQDGGLEFIIVNQGGGALNISPALKNGFTTTVSSLPAGFSFKVVYDGSSSVWRLVSKSQL